MTTYGFDHGAAGDKPPRMKRKKHDCTQASCDCWMCDRSKPRPKEEFICRVCSKVMQLDIKNIYRRTTSLPFGVKSACCGWHNFQPRCRSCCRTYLDARQAIDKVRAILRERGLDEGRLTAETYLKSVTLDVSKLSALASRQMLEAFTTTFRGARERPELFVKTGGGVRKVS